MDTPRETLNPGQARGSVRLGQRNQTRVVGPVLPRQSDTSANLPALTAQARRNGETQPAGARTGHRGDDVYGLELRAVVWDADGPHELDHDAVLVRPGDQAAVVATAPAASALADVVCGLARPVSGQVLADGRDLTGEPPTPSRVALVPVGAGLLPHLTVARNIDFGLDRASAPRAREAVVAALARQLQIEGALDLRPHRLSAEQRLRVAVARALGSRPVAVVVEDRDGEVSCAPAAQAASAANIAVLVITDSAARAERLSSRTYIARPA